MINLHLAKHEELPCLFASLKYDFTINNFIGDQTLELATWCQFKDHLDSLHLHVADLLHLWFAELLLVLSLKILWILVHSTLKAHFSVPKHCATLKICYVLETPWMQGCWDRFVWNLDRIKTWDTTTWQLWYQLNCSNWGSPSRS